ncbi:hypothetical protein KSX_01060 [Ktedonospora formicarum]|uniref:Uncharacterized protein n=1 Tax=Ktedonospora formicarum TaxID=2778364 RepID=A0A8J3HWK9_9CHLR|nr:hypothetical protein KSX_01060 [Ktedonospora formicarum]
MNAAECEARANSIDFNTEGLSLGADGESPVKREGSYRKTPPTHHAQYLPDSTDDVHAAEPLDERVEKLTQSFGQRTWG